MQADKDKLKDYANQVYAIIDPLGKSIYEANGIVANLDSYDDFIFTIDNVRKVTKEQYNRYAYLLSQFATTIGKMSDDYKTNPWRGSHLSVVSNEFRHDVTARLNSLLPKIKELDFEFAQILTELHLDAPHTSNDVKAIIELLNCASIAYSIPSEWILTDEIQPLYDEVEECIELKTRLITLTDELVNVYTAVHFNEAVAPISAVEQLDSQALLEEERRALTSFIATQAPYSYWSVQQISEVLNFLNAANLDASFAYPSPMQSFSNAQSSGLD